MAAFKLWVLMSNSDLLTIFDFLMTNLHFVLKVTHIPYLHLDYTLEETTQGRHTGPEKSLATITFSMMHILTGQYPGANASI